MSKWAWLRLIIAWAWLNHQIRMLIKWVVLGSEIRSSTMSASTKPLVLYTVPTPNGLPISFFLEDLKAINPIVDYEWAYRAPHKPWLTSVLSVEKISFQNNTQKVHINTLATCEVSFAMLNESFYRNLGSLRWIPTVESLSLLIAPVEIFMYSNHLPFCYILRSTTTKVTYSGLMPRRTPTITAKCFSGFFLLYVTVLVHEVRERGLTNPLLISMAV